MINTIFWFADSKSQYDQELATQGVSDKTIVFIKDTGEIYLNNKKYGNTLQDILNDPDMEEAFQDSALKQQVQEIINALDEKHDTDISTVNSKYDDLEDKHNLDIQRLEALINANKTSSDEGDAELNRKINNAKSEWNTNLNNAKTEINNKIDTAEQDAATARQNIINNVNSSISDMNTAISSATTTASQAAQRAQDIYDSIDSTVSSAVQDAIQDANLSGNFGEVNTKINKLENGLSAVTTRVDNVVDNNGNIKYDVYQTIINNIIEDDSALTEIGSKVSVNNQLTEKEVEVVEWWASEVQTYAENGSTFAQMVAAVDGGGSGSGEGVSEAYVIAKIQESLDGYVALTELNAKIQECQAFVNVQSTANTASTNVLAVQGSLQSLESDISSIENDIDQLETNQTGFNTTIAGLTSRVTDQEAKTSFIANYNANSGAVFSLTASEAESLMNSIVQHENAVATIKSVTTTDESGVDINTIVDGKIATAMTGYATQSWVDNDSNVASAVTNITNAIKDSNGQLISSADILTKANTNESNISALSSTVSGHTTSIAGLQTSTNDNASAISSLTSRVSATEGNITTINNAGFISSANVDTAVAGLFASNSSSNTKSAVEANIVATVNNGSSNISLSADKINFTGSSNFEGAVQAVDLNADNITSGTLSADRIDATNLHVSAANIDGTITATSLAIKNASNETVAALNSDGSGQIAKSGISWTTSGGLTLSQAFLQSLTQALRTGASTGGSGTVAGQTESMIVAGNTVPPTITIFGINYPLITADASTIYYYNFSDASSSGQYPYGGSDSEKKQWLQNSISGWMFIFQDGLLQQKHARDIYSGQSFDNLSGSDIDQRVDVITKLSNSTLATTVGLPESNYKGEFTWSGLQNVTPMEYDPGFSGTSTDDWLIVGYSNDPINSVWRLYKWEGSNWIAHVGANGASLHLYQHSK